MFNGIVPIVFMKLSLDHQNSEVFLQDQDQRIREKQLKPNEFA